MHLIYVSVTSTISQNQLGISPTTISIFEGVVSKFSPSIVISVPPPKDTNRLFILKILTANSKSSAVSDEGWEYPHPVLYTITSYLPYLPPANLTVS